MGFFGFNLQGILMATVLFVLPFIGVFILGVFVSAKVPFIPKLKA